MESSDNLKTVFKSVIMELTPNECQQLLNMWKVSQNEELSEKNNSRTTES